MIVKAPAKINLNLHVVGQRPDGYHLLESLVAFADVGDLLSFSEFKEDKLTFSGPFGHCLAADPNANLVLKAIKALRAYASARFCPPVAIHLEKNLPIASGIGGGSADAAATLRGLNQHWGLALSDAELVSIGATLGADVPMCIYNTPLIAKGIGNIIEPIQELPDLLMLLVNPGVAVSTPAIFTRLEKKTNAALPSTASFSNGKMTGSRLLSYLRSTRNDLEAPALALCPVIGDVLAALQKNGALFARMSGSGATCFGIFEHEASRHVAAKTLASQHPAWWVA